MQLFNTEYNNGKNSLVCCFLNELNVRKLEEAPIHPTTNARLENSTAKNIRDWNWLLN